MQVSRLTLTCGSTNAPFRLRHVKCDETRPGCHRCRKADRVCLGYSNSAPLKKSTDGLGNRTSQFSILCPASDLVGSVPGTASECHHFDFFRSQTLPVIDDGFHCSFWDQLVFQISAVDPAVRSAIVALAKCHREQTEGAESTAASTRYYVESINKLQKHISSGLKGNTVFILCCCVIFTAYEIVRGNGSVASLHLHNGLRILAEYDRSRNNRLFGPDNGVIEDVIPVFVRLNIQSRANLRPTTPENSFNLPLAYPPDIPTIFKDLTQARDVLSILYEKGFSLFQTLATANETGQAYQKPSSGLNHDSHSDAIQKEQNLVPSISAINKARLMNELMVLRSNLQNWTSAFENTITNLRALSPTSELADSDLNRSLTLRIHLIVAQIIMSTCTSASSTAFDAHTQAFRDLVSHADRLIKNAGLSYNSNSSASYSKASFSLDLGIVNPLRWVVTSCRHSKVRRDALDLLKSLGNRREGSWNASTAAKSAEWAIAIEEGKVNHESELWYTDLGQVWLGSPEASSENQGSVDESRLKMGGNEFVGLGIDEREMHEGLQPCSLTSDAGENSIQSRIEESGNLETSDTRQSNDDDDACKVVRRIRRLHTEVDREKGLIRLVPIFE